MIHIRKGSAADIPAAFALVKELAIFEKAPEQVITSEKIYSEDAFGGARPWFEFFVAEDFEFGVVGVAIFYFGYSTWKGRMLYLDDLVIKEDHRRKGIGKMLLDKLVAYGKEKGVNQMRWQVLDWNEPAIKLYKKVGASIEDEWLDCKLSKEQIESW
ncbi:MAG: GNAT family N-acetyltransferase [Bacteroidota bacterium]